LPKFKSESEEADWWYENRHVVDEMFRDAWPELFEKKKPAVPVQTKLRAWLEGGGKFLSLSEPWANTTTHAGKMIMTVFAGIAEFERDLIRERTGAGREAAKQRGVRFGRTRKLNPDQAQVASQLLSEGKAVRDVARTFKVHEATIYRLAAS
jgi:hypothetical protein